MVIFKQAQELTHYLQMQHRSVGFVPTMGALHKGHISLIEDSKKAGLLTVCSIFVNPTQFNEKADFEKYPVMLDADIALLLAAGCDVLFAPPVEEVYPHGLTEPREISVGRMDTLLEGLHRPGHFAGVTQVVSRLLDIVEPHVLFLGQKDYQQCLVIKTLLQQTGRAERIALEISPTVREEDGLAMSSRNARLTEPQRAVAGTIYQCLVSIQNKTKQAPFERVKKECEDLLSQKGFTVEYIALADAENLNPLTDYDDSVKMIALIAARIGDVRLIDNMLINS